MSSHIKTLLSPLLQSQQESWKIALLAQWPTILGNLSQHVSVEKIHDDSITLGVLNSSWLQELYLMGPTILDTINKSLDHPRFKTIRFKQRGIKKPAKKKNKNKPYPEQLAPITLSYKEEKALNSIEDPELKKVLHSFLERCYREKKRT